MHLKARMLHRQKKQVEPTVMIQKAEKMVKKRNADRKVEWLEALDAIELKPIVLPTPFVSQTEIKTCSCGRGPRYCEAIQGDDTWLTENFGCGFAKLLSEHFYIDEDETEPVFRRLFIHPYQTRPLRLRSQNTERAILEQVDACDLLLKRLGYKKAFRSSAMQEALKMVHQRIYDRLHN